MLKPDDILLRYLKCFDCGKFYKRKLNLMYTIIVIIFIEIRIVVEAIQLLKNY